MPIQSLILRLQLILHYCLINVSIFNGKWSDIYRYRNTNTFKEMARFKHTYYYIVTKKGDTCFKSDEVISSKIGKYLAYYPHVDL